MESFNNRDFIINIESGIRITPDAFKIGEAAVLGMLFEVSTYPSPGLVSPVSKGAHEDMDFFLFLRSTSSIAHIMYLCAQTGIDYDDHLLQRLRCIGKIGEKMMLDETEGVNTQRGLLFLAGVVCGAAGRCIRLKKIPDRKNIAEECSRICSGIVENELCTLNSSENTAEERESSVENKCSKIWNELTNGEKLYLKYGITGIRGEIEKGLPSVVNTGLPCYEDALKTGLDTSSSLAHALISLMSVVEDTTVVNRCGNDGLEYMRNSALFAVKLGGMKTLDGKEYIINMDSDFTNKKISPGGAADLLAVTVMIKKIEENYCREI